jgi:hypothetical protein
MPIAFLMPNTSGLHDGSLQRARNPENEKFYDNLARIRRVVRRFDLIPRDYPESCPTRARALRANKAPGQSGRQHRGGHHEVAHAQSRNGGRLAGGGSLGYNHYAQTPGNSITWRP